MQYKKTVTGTFLSRPNRFVAVVEIQGKEEVCHVKNTGRCRELLIPGCTVILSDSQWDASPASGTDIPSTSEVSDSTGTPKGRRPSARKPASRKTRYDLIAVYKGDLLINMDSQAPNAAAGEWLAAGGLFALPQAQEAHLGNRLLSLRPETVYGSSRFDFFLETDTCQMFLEVKGVTLEEQGVLKFPDAPTERGIKHLTELSACIKEGYRAGVLFVIQMEDALYFTPNAQTHPAFAQALTDAREKGVLLFAMNCTVAPDRMDILAPVPIQL